MSFDFDLFVIGAGSGGVRCSRFATSFGAKVAVAESRYLGGTCVNVGCVPKKLLTYGAHFSDDFAHAQGYGWTLGTPTFDWQTLIENKDREIARLNDIYRNLLVNSGVTLLEGHARIIDKHTVAVEGKQYRCQTILIATGGWPHIPQIPGHELAISSNEVFHLKQLPKRVLVVGGGYIAVEFASIFHGLGADTKLLYRGDLFLKDFDQDVRQHLKDEFDKKSLQTLFNTDIKCIARQADGSLLATLQDDSTLVADAIVYATGRRPMLDNLGLESTQVKLDERGFIEVNEHYQTCEPSIYAIGDVIGRVQLTPVALAEGMAVARKLFAPEQYRAVDYSNIATAVFSLPNIATVGLTEQQAKEQYGQIRVFESRFKPMKLTMTDDQERVYMKLIVDVASDRVVGCHMVGPDAGELIQGLAVAIKAGATKAVFDETIGIHPTAAEEFVTMRSASR